jgi:hypothetical protein
MANAGYSSDCKLVRNSIDEGNLLTIHESEHPISKRFKSALNELILNDKSYHYKYGGKTYYSHSAWSESEKILIKINQLRLKYWYWEKISF